MGVQDCPAGHIPKEDPIVLGTVQRDSPEGCSPEMRERKKGRHILWSPSSLSHACMRWAETHGK